MKPDSNLSESNYEKIINLVATSFAFRSGFSFMIIKDSAILKSK